MNKLPDYRIEIGREGGGETFYAAAFTTEGERVRETGLTRGRAGSVACELRRTYASAPIIVLDAGGDSDPKGGAAK